jgi:hypothetical protein
MKNQRRVYKFQVYSNSYNLEFRQNLNLLNSESFG